MYRDGTEECSHAIMAYDVAAIWHGKNLSYSASARDDLVTGKEVIPYTVNLMLAS